MILVLAFEDLLEVTSFLAAMISIATTVNKVRDVAQLKSFTFPCILNEELSGKGAQLMSVPSK